VTDAIVDEMIDEIVAGVAAPGAIVTRRPFAYATSHRLEEIEVRGARGAPQYLVAKHLGRHAMTEAARIAKPAAMHCAGREVAVYRHVLAGADIGTPNLVAGWADGDDAGDGVLVLERVDGTPLAEIGDFAVWQAVARWLARMHATFSAVPRITASDRGPLSSLLRYDRDLLTTAGRRGLERASEQRLGEPEMLVALAARHEYALRALESASPTLVHGDFYPANIIVSGDRIAVVDWELTGTGPAVLDLAALGAGAWSAAERFELIRAYHEEALTLRVTETLTALVRRVELASLHLALRWIGSAPEWDTPEEHRRDWFADAVAALDRLDRGTP
jgi:aminoglycoside phosphotransferase (APT) family kinase protein